MSNVINQNLDEIISIKNQLSNVLIENGVEAGNRFSDYPDMFRSVIASGGSFNPSYYYTADEIDENFVSYSYLAAALEDIDVDVDLDDYVTYSYAYNTFVSYAYLGDLEQISEYILGSGSSSAPENVYATKSELGAYVSKIELSTLSYATEQYVDDEISNIDLPVIDENIVPKESSTYTLGDADHLYARTYTGSIQSASGGLTFRVGSSNTITIGGGDMRPSTDGAQSLGRSANHWNNGYINNIYTNTAYLQDTSYSSSIVPKETATYTLGDTNHFYSNSYITDLWTGTNNKFSNRSDNQVNLMLNNGWKYTFHSNGFSPANDNNQNLGQSTSRWRNTYTANLWADNIHNFIWTGTSAEYAALDNYTTYQIYMIKES